MEWGRGGETGVFWAGRQVQGRLGQLAYGRCREKEGEGEGQEEGVKGGRGQQGSVDERWRG
jgi:hypothetical protein